MEKRNRNISFSIPDAAPGDEAKLCPRGYAQCQNKRARHARISGAATLLPTVVDTDLRKWVKDTVAHSKTTTGLERLLGAERWGRTLKTNEVCRSPKAIMARARMVKASHDEVLRQRFGGLMPSHMVGDAVLSEEGVIHTVSDSKGKAAFDGVFDTEKWAKPTGVI